MDFSQIAPFFSLKPKEENAKIEPILFFKDIAPDIEIDIKREDLIHPLISGNKWRKLKFNLQDAKGIISFGGAHSNHIFSLAAAGKCFNIQTVGVIRGNEFAQDKSKWSKTLQFAEWAGMKLLFVDRDTYRKKEDKLYLDNLEKQYPNYNILPEGGSNVLGYKGCKEILKPEQYNRYDYILCCSGTGATVAGIIAANSGKAQIWAMPVVNHPNIKDDIELFLHIDSVKNKNFNIVESHFGKYGLANEEILKFKLKFENKTGIKLDGVYTAKMLFKLNQILINKEIESNSKVLVIHTGGYQASFI
jgi:1-aminocyclopropane-1-carboxylate deaminase